ncbi:hypothetical protein [Marimonas lutisalis]|uniref:hypothetical protein n=1 Tax=Marimonas lutisalis TaxID=2545756 RepID=UPI0010F97DC2|nr:hypothetical protein [Marimonas lutisalis]
MSKPFRYLLAPAALILALAQPALAGSLTDAVAAQLRAQGFASITISQTWLGRTRIVALAGSVRREIILNPRTGEILRDYAVDENDERKPIILGVDGGVAPAGSDADAGDDAGGVSGDDGSSDGNGPGPGPGAGQGNGSGTGGGNGSGNGSGN